MEDGVKNELAESAQAATPAISESARENFRRLEALRDAERERAFKAETESALLKQKLELYEQKNAPESDPLDGVEDYVDPTRHKASLAALEKRMKREAEEIAERKLREYRNKEHQTNHMQRLKSEFNDFSAVMTQENVVALEAENPEFVQSLLHIQDDYERKKLAYNFMKRSKKALTSSEPPPSIKSKVAENQANHYYHPTSTATPAPQMDAVEFDISTPKARQAAYAKLKTAQRRPIGGGVSAS